MINIIISIKINQNFTFEQEIIDKLIENSASFSSKTEYSQEKYIKKKKEKYLPVYRILKPNIRTLCEYYMLGNNKRKIL